MVVLRCTHKLLVRLKPAVVPADVESTTRLGDWYGNVLRIWRRQYLIFISERSRLPVVIPIGEVKRLETVFPDAVCDVLAAADVAADDITDERFADVRNRVRADAKSQRPGNSERLCLYGAAE